MFHKRKVVIQGVWSRLFEDRRAYRPRSTPRFRPPGRGGSGLNAATPRPRVTRCWTIAASVRTSSTTSPIAVQSSKVNSFPERASQSCHRIAFVRPGPTTCSSSLGTSRTKSSSSSRTFASGVGTSLFPSLKLACSNERDVPVWRSQQSGPAIGHGVSRLGGPLDSAVTLE